MRLLTGVLCTLFLCLLSAGCALGRSYACAAVRYFAGSTVVLQLKYRITLAGVQP